PLALDVRIDQNGLPNPDKVQIFIGSRWGRVTPFALVHADPASVGPPPALGTASDADYRRNFADVVRYASQLDPETSPTLIDASPRTRGNNPLGTNDGTGYGANPVTGEEFIPNQAVLGDFSRVVAEFWADGPNSETPPGHWNVLANYVSD